MMNFEADLPVTITVKAANQQIADQTVNCTPSWTIMKLKQHLQAVYPSNPCCSQQKLIYLGRLLADHLILRDVLRQAGKDHSTFHLLYKAVTNRPSPAKDSALSGDNQCGVSSDVAQSTAASGSSFWYGQALCTTNSDFTGSAADFGRCSSVGSGNVTGPPRTDDVCTVPGMEVYAGAAMSGGVMWPQYTPEQAAWMQQMYFQYWAQWTQYYSYLGYHMPAGAGLAPHAAAQQIPPPETGTGTAPGNIGVGHRRGVVAEEQRAPDADVEGPFHNVTDYVLNILRILVFFLFVLSYSTSVRVVSVLCLGLVIYVLQKRGGTVLWRFLAGPGAERNGMQRLPRDAEGNGDGEPGGHHQQAHVSEGVEQGVEEQPPLPPIQEQRSVRRHDGNEGTPDDAESHSSVGNGSPGRPVSAPRADGPRSPVSRPLSALLVLVRMILSFFTSLVPSMPNAVAVD